MNKEIYLVLLTILLAGCATVPQGVNVEIEMDGEITSSGLGTGILVNSQGQTVRTIFKNQVVVKGANKYSWDGLDDGGKSAESSEVKLLLELKRWKLRMADSFGGVGASPGRFLNPQSLCAASQGSRLTVAVADTGNNRIQLLTDAGGVLQEIGQFGLGDQRLNQPTDIDWDGQIFTVCDSQNQRLARFDGTGAYLGEVRQLSGFQTSPSHPVNLDFQNPMRLQRDGGSFWVSDTGYSVLDFLTVSGGLIQQLGGQIPLGNIGSFLKWPDGNIWVQTSKNEIRTIDSNGRDQGQLKVIPPFQSVADMALSPEGFAVVSDPSQGLLYFLDSIGGCFLTIAPEGCLEPGGLSISNNHLFVIDQDQNKIYNYEFIPIEKEEYQGSIVPDMGIKSSDIK
jgi:hypothetical protein